jgi:hypothetical protein
MLVHAPHQPGADNNSGRLPWSKWSVSLQSLRAVGKNACQYVKVRIAGARGDTIHLSSFNESAVLPRTRLNFQLANSLRGRRVRRHTHMALYVTVRDNNGRISQTSNGTMATKRSTRPTRIPEQRSRKHQHPGLCSGYLRHNSRRRIRG